MPVSLNTTAAIASGWLDKPAGERLLSMPPAQRDSAALALAAQDVRGLGPGSQNTLAEALDTAAPSIRDYLEFMERPSAATELQSAAARRTVGGNVVGIMLARFNAYKAADLDG